MKLNTSKRRAVLIVIAFTVMLSVLLISVSDADVQVGSKLDAKVTARLTTSGTIRTQAYSQWELWKYKSTTLPKKKPFKYAPWVSYLAIDKYVTVSCDGKYNTLTIDSGLYEAVRDDAKYNKVKAKEILKKHHVKGTGKKACKKIYKYVASGKYISGVKSARGFFDNHGGDCSAHTSAFYVLCQVQGIPVRWCMGGNDEGGLHAWNRVKFGGEWWWVDATGGYGFSKKLWFDHKKPMEMW